MIPVIKRLGFAGIAALNLEWLKRTSPINVISPFHHLVSDEPVPYIEKLYAFKNSRQFEADLDYLLRHFRPLSLEEVIQQEKTGRPFEKPGFLICFDDGLRQVYETAAPILLRKGVPAAFFINAAFVDNQDIFYNFKKGLILDKFDQSPVDEKILGQTSELLEQKFASPRELRASIRSINYLNRQLMEGLGRIFQLDFEAFRKEQRPFMTTPEIKELLAKGFAVGSHSIDHPLYALLPPEEQIRQTRESTDWVIKTFNLPYKAFAFPHIDTGVGHAFFEEFVGGPALEMDLLLGNSTGMLERHPRVIHRFIGENPAIPIDTMIKSVLAYGVFRKKIGRSFVPRT
jgi:peptidoglycan/xylan/chitin deacetylase (PgdA/CDA1 family)